MDTLSREAVWETLNAGDEETRLRRLQDLAVRAEAAGMPPQGDEVNNHVHTCYSFSPYSPSGAVWFARQAGLKAVGSMDHDSVGAARETMAAGKILGMAVTVGFELRVNFSGTALEGRKLNNPDSKNIVYMTFHGIPEGQLDRAAAFLRPIQEERNRRNRRETEALNELIAPLGIGRIDFQTDVYDRSLAARGGGITERHILFALARKIADHTGRGEGLIAFLEEKMGLAVTGRIREYLADKENPHYLYDLLGILKGNYLSRFFIQPDERECPSVYDAVRFGNEIGAIPSYAYLGDVGESPTGDKRAEKFEDGFLDELIPELKRVGFRAVTYMPPRNTPAQLKRVRTLCAAAGLMEISGVDINSSRQSFNCPEILRPDFSHLIGTTWALIAHEKLSAGDLRFGLFHRENPLASRSLEERIALYARWGEALDPRRPEEIPPEAMALLRG